MNNESERTLIFEFEKNSSEVVRITMSRFKDRDYCDFRVWTVGTAKDLGEKLPTKKGLMISVEILPDLLAAVQAAISYVRDGEEDRSADAVSDFPE